MLKRLTFALLVLVLLSSTLFADTKETIVVDKSLLTPGQLTAAEAKQKVETVAAVVEAQEANLSIYGGWGREIGVAVKEMSEAVGQQASKFFNSSPGKIAVALLVWKVAGVELLRFLIGIAMMAVILPTIYSIYRTKYLPHKVVVSRTGWWIFGTKTYEDAEIFDDASDGEIMGGHFVLAAVIIGVSLLVMFI